MQQQGLHAIVLAYAGIKRLGYEELITEVLPCELLLPAVGQGAIGVEIRSDDENTAAMLALINHEATRLEVLAERSFTGSGGRMPDPYRCPGTDRGDKLSISGMVASLDGSVKYQGVAGQARKS